MGERDRAVWQNAWASAGKALACCAILTSLLGLVGLEVPFQCLGGGILIVLCLCLYGAGFFYERSI